MTLFWIGNIFERIFVFVINRLPDEYIKQTTIRSKRAQKLVKALEKATESECTLNQSTMKTEIVGHDTRAAAVLILLLSYLTLMEHKASRLLKISDGRRIEQLMFVDLDRIIKGERMDSNGVHSVLNGKLINMSEYLLDEIMMVEYEAWDELLVERLDMDAFTVRALVEYATACSGFGYQPTWADLSQRKKICVATSCFLNALKQIEGQSPSTRTSAIIQNLESNEDEQYVIDDSIQYNLFQISEQGNDITVWFRFELDIHQLLLEATCLMDLAHTFYKACADDDRAVTQANVYLGMRK